MTVDAGRCRIVFESEGTLSCLFCVSLLARDVIETYFEIANLLFQYETTEKKKKEKKKVYTFWAYISLTDPHFRVYKNLESAGGLQLKNITKKYACLEESRNITVRG